ncbi:PapB/FocB family fimbrial expression transcriptional regulator [Escherichia coli]
MVPTTYLVDTTLSNSSDSDQTVQAVRLREYLVYGYSKQESCDRNNVSNSYFCLCLKKLNYTHGIVSALKYFYQT